MHHLGKYLPADDDASSKFQENKSWGKDGDSGALCVLRLSPLFLGGISSPLPPTCVHMRAGWRLRPATLINGNRGWPRGVSAKWLPLPGSFLSHTPSSSLSDASFLYIL